MRLLEAQGNGSFSLVNFQGKELPSYAILSHTWGVDGEELTYEDLRNNTGQEKVGYKKLEFCKRQAAKDDLHYFWIDSCCIDKSSSAELSEAINSMFNWYRKASKCYVYLSDVSSINSSQDGIMFSDSRWFTRGWTLQELIAPQCVQFFSKEGELIGDKHSQREEIATITNIPIEALQEPNISGFSIEQRMRWAENRETTREEDRVYSLLGICNIYMPPIYGEGEDHARRRMNKLLREPEESRAQKLNDIQRWIPAPDPSVNYQKALKQRQHDTGLWFLKDERYASWNSGDASFLWLYGIPGCGKTILSSTIVEDISQYCDRNSGYAFAYFYFDFNDVQKQDSERMIRSLVLQLSEQADRIPSKLDALFSSHDNGRRPPALDELSKVFCEMIREFSQVFIVLDALDECTQRSELMEVLEEIAGWNISNLHLLMTSRQEQDIKSCLEEFVDKQNRMCLQRDIVDKDIQLYVRQRLSHDKKLIKWRNDTALQQEIEDTLMKDTLGNCLNRSLLRKALKTLPSTLDKTYERILKNINDEYAEYAVRILQWLAFSERPLSIHEIAEVVAIDVSRDPEFDPEEVLEDPLDALKICSSLITTTKSKDWVASIYGQRREHIILAHYSVKEFLLSDRIQRGPAARYGLKAAVCHSALAMACLSYLNQFQEIEAMREETLNNFKLASYAAHYWHIHARKVEDQATEVDRLTLRLLSTENVAYFNWIGIHDPDLGLELYDAVFENRIIPTTRSNDNTPKPLYYASLLGLEGTVRSLLAKGADANASGGIHYDALRAASIRGYENVVKTLLSAGADVNAQSGDCSVLHSAIKGRHEGVIRVLLERGANVGPDRQLGGALHHAVDMERCTPSLVSMLIEFGAPTITVDADGMTPLHYCIVHSHSTIAAQLIDANVPVNIRAHRGRRHTKISETIGSQGLVPPFPECIELGPTPLHFSALTGDVIMTKLLLNYGADPNACSTFGETPLHVACGMSFSDIIRQESRSLSLNKLRIRNYYKEKNDKNSSRRNFDALSEVLSVLLAHPSVSPNVKDYNGQNPLHYIRYGRSDSAIHVRGLVSHGTDPTCCNTNLQTPLHFAIRAGDLGSVKALIDLGAKVAQEDDQGLNALHYAARSGNYRITAAILGAKQANAASLGASRDRSGKNALHHLFDGGASINIRTVKLLIDQGADSSAVDNSGNTPLAVLACRAPDLSDFDIWRFLLGMEGNKSWMNSKGQNLGHVCCFQNALRVPMLSTLHECGVDLSKKDCKGKTVLHIAAMQGSLNKEILAYLVDVVGLRVTERDGRNRSAWQYATKDQLIRYRLRIAPGSKGDEYEKQAVKLMKELMSSPNRKRKRSSVDPRDFDTRAIWV